METFIKLSDAAIKDLLNKSMIHKTDPNTGFPQCSPNESILGVCHPNKSKHTDIYYMIVRK